MKILSFDIGGSKTSYAMVSKTGCLLSEVTTIPTPKKNEDIINLIQKAATENTFDGFALATAGVVNKGKIAFKPNNLPSGYDKIEFSSLLRKTVLIENDANAAAWAEYKVGALKGTENAVMLTLGTGVGCGIIVNGKLVHGKCGAAGEVFFPLAGCDLIATAQKNGLKETDCFAVYDLVNKKNAAAISAYQEWEKNLVDNIILLNSILDMERVVLSGSLAKLVDYATVEKAVNKKMPHNPISIQPAQCENNAGLIGAALLLKEQLEQDGIC